MNPISARKCLFVCLQISLRFTFGSVKHNFIFREKKRARHIRSKCNGILIEEGWKQRARQRSFASVYLEETVEFSRSIWKKRLNLTISFKSTATKQLARQGVEQMLTPQTDATTFALPSISILLLWVYWCMSDFFT